MPPRDPEAPGKCMEEVNTNGARGRYKLGEAARKRILGNFNLPDIVARYEALYREVAWPHFCKRHFKCSNI